MSYYRLLMLALETHLAFLKLLMRLGREHEEDWSEDHEHHTHEEDWSEDHPNHNTHRENITLAVITTDDFAVRVKPAGLDADGVSTALDGVTASVDQPALAEVVADADNPGQFLVRRLPTTDPAAGALSVNATFTTMAGVSATLPVEFDPGTAASLTLGTELVANSASSNPAAP